MKIAVVEYQYATYHGTIEVNISEDDCNDDIIAKAKRKLKKYKVLPMAYERYMIKDIIEV